MWSPRGRALRGIGGVSLAVAFVGSVFGFAMLPRAGATPQQPPPTGPSATWFADSLALLPPSFGTAVGAASVAPPSSFRQIAHTVPRRDPAPVVMPITGAAPRGGFGTRGPMWAVAHSGLDFSTGIGTPAVAVVSGTIRAVFMHPSFGWVEELQRSDGVEFWYCHLSQPIAEPGQTVKQGQVVGLTGDTGNTSGPHLHFEVRVDGVPTDPADFLFNHPGTPGPSPSWAQAYRQEPPPGRTIIGWPPTKEEKEKAAREKAAREKAVREKAARKQAARDKAARDKGHVTSSPTARPTPTPTPSFSADTDPEPTPSPTRSQEPTSEPTAPTAPSSSAAS